MAQPPAKYYSSFGGNGIDIGYGVTNTLEGKYAIVGSTNSFGNGSTDVYFIKVDSMGFANWQTTYGGALFDVGKSLLQLPDSSYVICGYTNSFGAGGYDAYLLRIDKNGILMWQKTWGGLDWDFGNDIILAPDGNLIMCGKTASFGNGGYDGFVAKFDINGNLIWQKFYGGTLDDDLRSIIATNDNVLATCGQTKSFGEPNGDCYFLKLDLLGDTLFTKRAGGPYIDYWSALTQIGSNDYVLAGAKTFSASAPTHSYKIAYDYLGNYKYDNIDYNSTGDERWISIDGSTLNNNFFAAVRDIPIPAFAMQGCISVYFNYFFTPAKVNPYGGYNDENMYCVRKTKWGGYVSVGTTQSFNAVNGDVFFMKQDSTIGFYTSIVGQNNVTIANENIKLINLGNNEYSITISSEKTVKCNIIGINGVYYDEILLLENDKINLNKYNENVFFIEVKNKFGQKIKVFKVIKT